MRHRGIYIRQLSLGRNGAVITCASLTVIVFLLATAVAARQSEPGNPSAETSQRWDAQLEALHPARPMEYFELAEDVIDAASSDEDRALARHLFALAGALDAPRLGRSAALALADMEADAPTKRRLLALASLLGGGGGAAPNDIFADGRHGGETALLVCEALSLYRRGRGPQALNKLENPDAAALLKQHGDLLPGGYNQFMQDCRIYKGDLRPTINEAELARMLQLEEAILAGDDRSWSSDLLVNDAAPLIEIDPTRVAEALKVSPEYSTYRAGRWVKAE